MAPQNDTERQPLLQNGTNGGDDSDEELITFEEDDDQDPKNWALRWKYFQVLQVTLIGLLCPLTSSITTPANDSIASTFGVEKSAVIAVSSGFVHMLGIGPLFLAPMSETFGRRPIFLINFAIFTLLQVPAALVTNLPGLIVIRTITGLFGSVGVANGGGTISDMFEAKDRAPVLGIYLLGPLLGPSLGPLFGGLIDSQLGWRWIFWIVFIVSTLLTVMCFFCLLETRAPIILSQRKSELQQKHPDKQYKVDGASDEPIHRKILSNCSRALCILFTQPIVLIMSLYQALIFASMYSLYSAFTNIWTSPPYTFTEPQLALTYLFPATGFTLAAIFIVPGIDKLYHRLVDRNDGEAVPEYRLPLAGIGAVLLPISLFWFGWTVEFGKPWYVPLLATVLFGASQVCIFNTTQNYYIDSFEKFAASALAAGAFLRSIFGGQVPLYVGGLIDSLGYGWGMSVFGFLAVVLMPAPYVFWVFGGRIRERFAGGMK